MLAEERLGAIFERSERLDPRSNQMSEPELAARERFARSIMAAREAKGEEEV
jgi:hypothetical protein